MKRIVHHITFSAVVTLSFLAYSLWATDLSLPEDLCETTFTGRAYDIFGSGIGGCYINAGVAAYYFIAGTLAVLVCSAPIIELLLLFYDDFVEWLGSRQNWPG